MTRGAASESPTDTPSLVLAVAVVNALSLVLTVPATRSIDTHLLATMICPHCQRTIREERRYLMSVDPDRPGLFETLRGEAGEARRVLVTIAVCLLAVLFISGLSIAVGPIG